MSICAPRRRQNFRREPKKGSFPAFSRSRFRFDENDGSIRSNFPTESLFPGETWKLQQNQRRSTEIERRKRNVWSKLSGPECTTCTAIKYQEDKVIEAMHQLKVEIMNFMGPQRITRGDTMSAHVSTVFHIEFSFISLLALQSPDRGGEGAICIAATQTRSEKKREIMVLRRFFKPNHSRNLCFRVSARFYDFG